MLSSSWGNLSFELLEHIFDFVDCTQEDRQTTFTAFQLVCQNWRAPAQQSFYKEIYLGKDDVEFNIALEKLAPHLVNSIKRVVFCPSFSDNQNITNVVEAIIEQCRNIEEIHTKDDITRGIVYPFLVSEKNKITGLKRITEFDSSPNLFTDIALKYSNTFSELRIREHFDHSHTQPLIPQLKRFANLKKLAVYSIKEQSDASIDQIISHCSSTVHTLELCGLYLTNSNDEALIARLKPNDHVKNLKVSVSGVRGIPLVYLEAKFKALKTVELIGIACQATEVWWNLFRKFYLAIETAQVSLNFPYQDADYSYTKCMDLLYKSVPEESSRKYKKKLRINFLKFPSNATYVNCRIDIEEQGNSREILVNTVNNKPTDLKKLLVNSIPYSPDQVGIFVDDVSRFFEVPQQPNNAFMALDEIQQVVGDYNDMFLNWESLNHSLSMISQAQNSDLRLWQAFLFVSQEPMQKSKLDISKLVFSDSFLDHNAFPSMSQRIQTIGHLEIDQCCILMDRQYTLQMFMPHTTVQTLVFTWANPSDLCYFEQDYYYESIGLLCSFFGNPDFQQAVSPDGHFILKIETSIKTFVYKVENSQLSRVSDPAADRIIDGTSDNFLVWFKFLDLNEFCVHVDSKEPNIFEKLQK